MKFLIEVHYDPSETKQIDITDQVKQIKGIIKVMVLRYSKPDNRLRGY